MPTPSRRRSSGRSPIARWGSPMIRKTGRKPRTCCKSMLRSPKSRGRRSRPSLPRASFADFKAKLADLAVSRLEPITSEMRRLMDDRGEIEGILEAGDRRRPRRSPSTPSPRFTTSSAFCRAEQSIGKRKRHGRPDPFHRTPPPPTIRRRRSRKRRRPRQAPRQRPPAAAGGCRA